MKAFRIGFVLIALGFLAARLWYQSRPIIGFSRASQVSAAARALPPNPPPEKLPIVTSVPDAPSLAGPRTPPAGLKEYRNEFYRFEMFYPDDLTPTVHDESGSAATITFQNADHSRSFQVFIVPYGDPKISKERFKTDLPSGIIDQPSNITVGGEPATEFYSTDSKVGDTREVWFVGRGFLYEITTYKELSDLLQPIVDSWMFL
jgi:hypothetical protein